nr:D-alanine--D-alanine ligase [uncultured bacterium]
MQRKLRVGIVFGGRSGEHEVSVASARSVMAAIDQTKYEVIPIAIARSGQWLPGVAPQALMAPTDIAPAEAVSSDTPQAVISDDTPTGFALLPQLRDEQHATEVDVIFPVLHGTYGEDGALQGMLEMAGLPYVGNGVLGAALGMDKDKAKLLFQVAGLPVVPWITVTRKEVESALDASITAIAARFGFPVFAKPANMGSSVGVTKAHDAAELRAALTMAARYDRKIVVEPAINCREIECGVLGNDDPEASVVGEILPSNEFYDYQAKYLDGASQLLIPAPIADAIALDVRRMAIVAFRALDLNGLARVDFFLDRDTDQVYLNEVNTMPGFTEISMYPKLWEVSGLTYPALIDRLIMLGIERHQERARNEIGVDF